MSQFVLTFTYLSSWLILPPLAFHILLHATVSAMDYTPNVVSKRCLFFIFRHSWAPKRSWKISRGGPGKSWKSPGFFPVKVGTLMWSVMVSFQWSGYQPQQQLPMSQPGYPAPLQPVNLMSATPQYQPIQPADASAPPAYTAGKFTVLSSHVHRCTLFSVYCLCH